MIDSGKFYASRLLILSGLILVILAGLALRRYGYTIGLPFLIVKYGGSVLWGAMVYLLAALLFVNRRTQLFIIAATCCFAIAVELLRLVHFPAGYIPRHSDRHLAARSRVLAVEYPLLFRRYRNGCRDHAAVREAVAALRALRRAMMVGRIRR